MPDLSRLVIAVEQDGVVTALKNLDDLAKVGKRAEESAGGLMAKFRDLQSFMQGPIAAFQTTKQVIGAVVGVGREMVDQYMEGARAMVQVEQIIKSTGGAAGVSVGQVEALAESLSKLTGIDDDKIAQAAAVMLTFKNVGSGVFDQAIESAADMSTVMGTDLLSATTMLGKALNDPIAGMSALGRVGVQLSATQEKQIKDFMKVNDLASAQAIIMQELQTEFGGTARAVGEQLGAFDKLGVSWGNLMGKMGGSITNILSPILESLSGIIDKLFEVNDLENKFNGNTRLNNLLATVSANDPVGLKQIQTSLGGFTKEMLVATQATQAFDAAIAETKRMNDLKNQVIEFNNELKELEKTSQSSQQAILKQQQSFSNWTQTMVVMPGYTSKIDYENVSSAIKKELDSVMSGLGMSRAAITTELKNLDILLKGGNYSDSRELYKAGAHYISSWLSGASKTMESQAEGLRDSIRKTQAQITDIASGKTIKPGAAAAKQNPEVKWLDTFETVTGIDVSDLDQTMDKGASLIAEVKRQFDAKLEAMGSTGTAIDAALGTKGTGLKNQIAFLEQTIIGLANSPDFNLEDALAGNGKESQLEAMLAKLQALKKELTKQDNATWLEQTIAKLSQAGKEIGETEAAIMAINMAAKGFGRDQIKQVTDLMQANEKANQQLEDKQALEAAILALRQDNDESQATLAGKEYDSTEALIAKLNEQVAGMGEEGDALRELIAQWEQLKAVQNGFAQKTELESIADSLKDQFGDPVDKYRKAMDEIQKAMAAGLITQDTATRATKYWADWLKGEQEAANGLAALSKELKSLGDQILQSALSTVITSFEDFGRSLAKGSEGADDFGSAFDSMLADIVKAMPQMMLSAGLQLCTAGQWGAGLALIAASGLMQLAIGWTEGAAEADSAAVAGSRSSTTRSIQNAIGSGRGSSAQNVTVEIIDQNNSVVQTSQSTGADGSRTIRALIMSTVADGVSRGQLDGVLGQRYALGSRGR